MRWAMAFLLAFSITGVSRADHHHKEWWDFLLGSWNYENHLGPAGDEKGELKFEMAPAGEALLAQWKSEDGSSALEVAGWQADKKIVQVNGYGNEGGYWQLEISKLGTDVQEGTHRGRLPDGTTYSGKTVLTKTGEHSWTWAFEGKDSNGQEIKMNGEVERSRGDRLRRSLQATQN